MKKWLAPPGATGANYIPEDEWTPWEMRMKGAWPDHNPAILSEWDTDTRDLVAFIRCELFERVKELGPMARPTKEASAAVQRYLTGTPGDIEKLNANWIAEYAADPVTRADKALEDGMVPMWRGFTRPDGTHGRAPANALASAMAAKERGEATPEQVALVDKAQAYADAADPLPNEAKTIDPAALAAPDLPPLSTDPLVQTLLGYASEVQHGAAHVKRWNQALTAIGHDTGEPALTLDDALECLARFSKDRWQPVVDRLRSQGPVGQLPTHTSGLAHHAATATEKGYVVPEHKADFIKYLERERDFLLEECGAGHPVNKHKIYDHYIETVTNDERMHSQEQVVYDDFLVWQTGAEGQRIGGTKMIYVDGRVVDYSIDPAPQAAAPEAKIEEVLKVVNERPDVEVRKYNPDTNTMDVLSPVTVPAAANAVEHPFVNPNRLEIPFRFPYDSCVGDAWYYHEEGLKKDREAYLKDPVWLRWLKAVDATDADVVPMERKEVNIKQEEWMGWHKHGAAMTSYLAAKRRFEHHGGKTELEAQEDWGKRTQEILAQAAKDVPTPADIAAAVAAGEWHKVAELAKAQAKAQTPPTGYVWFGRVRQGSIESGQYIAIGEGTYEDAILYLASSWQGEKPRLYQQNALNGPCRVHHTHDWNDTRYEGPYLRTWEEIRAQYDNI